MKINTQGMLAMLLILAPMHLHGSKPPKTFDELQAEKAKQEKAKQEQQDARNEALKQEQKNLLEPETLQLQKLQKSLDDIKKLQANGTINEKFQLFNLNQQNLSFMETDAALQELKRAHRALLLQWHPDKIKQNFKVTTIIPQADTCATEYTKALNSINEQLEKFIPGYAPRPNPQPQQPNQQPQNNGGNAAPAFDEAIFRNRTFPTMLNQPIGNSFNDSRHLTPETLLKNAIQITYCMANVTPNNTIPNIVRRRLETIADRFIQNNRMAHEARNLFIQLSQDEVTKLRNSIKNSLDQDMYLVTTKVPANIADPASQPIIVFDFLREEYLTKDIQSIKDYTFFHLTNYLINQSLLSEEFKPLFIAKCSTLLDNFLKKYTEESNKPNFLKTIAFDNGNVAKYLEEKYYRSEDLMDIVIANLVQKLSWTSIDNGLRKRILSPNHEPILKVKCVEFVKTMEEKTAAWFAGPDPLSTKIDMPSIGHLNISLRNALKIVIQNIYNDSLGFNFTNTWLQKLKDILKVLAQNNIISIRSFNGFGFLCDNILKEFQKNREEEAKLKKQQDKELADKLQRDRDLRDNLNKTNNNETISRQNLNAEKTNEFAKLQELQKQEQTKILKKENDIRKLQEEARKQQEEAERLQRLKKESEQKQKEQLELEKARIKAAAEQKMRQDADRLHKEQESIREQIEQEERKELNRLKDREKFNHDLQKATEQQKKEAAERSRKQRQEEEDAAREQERLDKESEQLRKQKQKEDEEWRRQRAAEEAQKAKLKAEQEKLERREEERREEERREEERREEERREEERREKERREEADRLLRQQQQKPTPQAAPHPQAAAMVTQALELASLLRR